MPTGVTVMEPSDAPAHDVGEGAAVPDKEDPDVIVILFIVPVQPLPLVNVMVYVPAARPVNVGDVCVIAPGFSVKLNGALPPGEAVIVPSVAEGHEVAVVEAVPVGAAPAVTTMLFTTPEQPVVLV